MKKTPFAPAPGSRRDDPDGDSLPVVKQRLVPAEVDILEAALTQLRQADMYLLQDMPSCASWHVDDVAAKLGGIIASHRSKMATGGNVSSVPPERSAPDA